MLELYEQNQAPSFNVNATEAEGNSTTSSYVHRSSAKPYGLFDEPTAPKGIPLKAAVTKTNSSWSATDHSHISTLHPTHKFFQNEVHSNYTSRENHWHRGSEIQVEHPMVSEKDQNEETKESNSSRDEAPKGRDSPPMLKRRKIVDNDSKKIFSMVNGVDLELEAGEVLHEKSGWSKYLNEQESHNQAESETTEEGELSFDNHDYETFEHGNRERKKSSPPLPVINRQDHLENKSYETTL